VDGAGRRGIALDAWRRPCGKHGRSRCHALARPSRSARRRENLSQRCAFGIFIRSGAAWRPGQGRQDPGYSFAVGRYEVPGCLCRARAAEGGCTLFSSEKYDTTKTRSPMFLETLAGTRLNRGPAITDIKHSRIRSRLDLASALRTRVYGPRWPDVPVIVISGYIDESRRGHLRRRASLTY
jgi:hypothetical protein